MKKNRFGYVLKNIRLWLKAHNRLPEFYKKEIPEIKQAITILRWANKNNIEIKNGCILEHGKGSKISLDKMQGIFRKEGRKV